MNIELEKTGDLTATLKIDLSPVDYEENVNKVLKDYQRKAQMPGFRPGKVPFSLTKKIYGQAATADEINKLLSDALDNYIKENNLQLLGNPLANTEKTQQMDFSNPGEMSFYFDLAMTPEFQVNLSSELGVTYYKITSTDKMASDYLADIRLRQGEMKEAEKVEKGDLVKGDLVELNEDNTVKEGGLKTSGSLNTNQLKNDEILNSLIGAQVGTTTTVDPDALSDNNTEKATMLGLAAETVNDITSKFNFTVTSINRMSPAEMNEDFYEKVFPGEEIKDEAAMLERIKKEADQSFVSESERKFFNDAIEAIIEDANISLPDSFVKRWLVETNPEKLTSEDVERDYEGYSRSLKWQLIENRMISENNISVSDEEVKDVFRGYFRRPGSQEMDEDTKKRIDSIADSFMKNKEDAGRIRTQLFEKKLIETLKEKLQPKTKNLTYEEFVKLPSK
ncbi:MAG TPA: trigger factor [Lentimicrobium sp.]|nr:trigger factor [Lentimicrobium sp.]